MNAAQIRDALLRRYPPERGYRAFFEVEWRQTRVDALVLGEWASQSYALHGFEIKVSRADWLRELRQPHKAALAAETDYWWLVSPPGVATPEELPPGWGHLQLGARGLKVVRPALSRPERGLGDLGAPLPRELVVTLLRRAVAPDPAGVRAQLDQAFARGHARGLEEGLSRGRGQHHRAELIDEAIRVQAEQGLLMHDLLATDLGRAAWALESPARVQRLRSDLTQLMWSLDRAAELISSSLTASVPLVSSPEQAAELRERLARRAEQVRLEGLPELGAESEPKQSPDGPLAPALDQDSRPS